MAVKFQFLSIYSLTYYSLTLASGSTNKNLYLGTALSGLVEIPAYGLCLLTLKYFGRVTNIACFMIVGGISLFVIPFTHTVFPLMTTSLSLLGKLCISSSFAIIYMHSNEIFPTTVRNSGMGIVSFSARIGGILAPHVVKLGAVQKNLHFLILGIICTISGRVTFT